MGALLTQFAAAGVRLESSDDGNLRAVGALTDELRTAIRAHKPALLAELADAANDAPARHWRVTLPDRPSFLVAVTPPADTAWMLHLYPGATVQPVPERPRTATPAEADELRRLIGIVLPGDPEAHAGAFTVAMADTDGALECYRTLANTQHKGDEHGKSN